MYAVRFEMLETRFVFIFEKRKKMPKMLRCRTDLLWTARQHNNSVAKWIDARNVQSVSCFSLYLVTQAVYFYRFGV